MFKAHEQKLARNETLASLLKVLRAISLWPGGGLSGLRQRFAMQFLLGFLYFLSPPPLLISGSSRTERHLGSVFVLNL